MNDLFAIFLIYAVGLALFVAEVFIPSAGTIGAAGILCVSFAVWQLFATEHPWLASSSALVAGIFVFWIARLALERTSSRTSLAGVHSPGSELTSLTAGTAGVAVSLLRPSGVALIGGRRVDVITRGEYIEANSPIQVVSVAGGRVVVAQVPALPTRNS